MWSGDFNVLDDFWGLWFRLRVLRLLQKNSENFSNLCMCNNYNPLLIFTTRLKCKVCSLLPFYYISQLETSFGRELSLSVTPTFNGCSIILLTAPGPVNQWKSHHFSNLSFEIWIFDNCVKKPRFRETLESIGESYEWLILTTNLLSHKCIKSVPKNSKFQLYLTQVSVFLLPTNKVLYL